MHSVQGVHTSGHARRVFGLILFVPAHNLCVFRHSLLHRRRTLKKAIFIGFCVAATLFALLGVILMVESALSGHDIPAEVAQRSLDLFLGTWLIVAAFLWGYDR